MQHLQVYPFFLSHAINVHEAAHIGTNQILCMSSGCVGYFLIGHGAADGIKLHGKAAAEATAGLYIVHCSQLQSTNVSQQGAWLLLNAHFP